MSKRYKDIQIKRLDLTPKRTQPYFAYFTGIMLLFFLFSGAKNTADYISGKILPPVAYASETTTKIVYITPTPTIVPDLPVELTPNQQTIVQEIRKVFGRYSDEAIRVANCESGLNTNAKGYNSDSIDYGVFQINNHWQGVTNERFLLDYQINIRMGWRVFEGNGYHFKPLWTCGRKLGI